MKSLSTYKLEIEASSRGLDELLADAEAQREAARMTPNWEAVALAIESRKKAISRERESATTSGDAA